MSTTTVSPVDLDSLPLLDSADVVVVGGGPGGIGAALAAARGGAKTVLIERFGCLGGTWTSGILSAIMPYPFVKGYFTEIAQRMTEAGGYHFMEGWGGANYDSETAKYVLDQIVLEAGVKVYFFVQLSGVRVENGRVTGIEVISKEGRHRVEGKVFVDSSGDGDLCALAGVPAEVGREQDGAMQPMTMIFKMAGIDSEPAWRAREADPGFTRAWQAAKARGEVTVPREDVLCGGLPREGQWHFNTTRVIGKDGTKVRDVSEAMIEARRQVQEVAQFMIKNIPGFEKAYILETAPHIGVRESRRIKCDYTVTAKDVIELTDFPDTIARGDWYIDIHSPTGEGTERVHPPEGQSYQVPYRSTTAQGVENVLVGSRCIDSTHEAHAAIRITPQVFAIGQGVGTAAAIMVEQSLASTRKVDITELRRRLEKQGAII
jgi:hypothetical protein